MKVFFERHPGFYSESMDYYNFYGLYFDSIHEVADMLKRVRFKEHITLEGTFIKKHKCLRDVDTDMINFEGQWFPDETFVEEYINGKHTKKISRRASAG